MTFYIVLAIIAVGMGGSIPLALHWDRQQRERQDRENHHQQH